MFFPTALGVLLLNQVPPEEGKPHPGMDGSCMRERGYMFTVQGKDSWIPSMLSDNESL